MNRIDKINLLNGIAMGKVSVKSLLPVQFVTLRKYADQPGVLYHEDKPLTQSEADDLIQIMQASSEMCWVEIRNYQS